jgi:hypothetical protein
LARGGIAPEQVGFAIGVEVGDFGVPPVGHPGQGQGFGDFSGFDEPNFGGLFAGMLPEDIGGAVAIKVGEFWEEGGGLGGEKVGGGDGASIDEGDRGFVGAAIAPEEVVHLAVLVEVATADEFPADFGGGGGEGTGLEAAAGGLEEDVGLSGDAIDEIGAAITIEVEFGSGLWFCVQHRV